MDIRNLIYSYFNYKKALKNVKDFPKYKVIFKFDDLSNCNKKVKRLDKLIKKEDIKVCWGIIGKSLENPDKSFIDFVKNNYNKNYQFFNHGYLHLTGPEYEFYNKSIESQESLIKKTQDIVYNKTGIILNIFGAPCNHIDENTKAALENISDIKYWFYGLDDFQGGKYNIKRITDMENNVGNPDFSFFFENLKNVRCENNIITLQGHPYMWKYKQRFNFRLIVNYLKKIGCEFIFPQEIGENND